MEMKCIQMNSDATAQIWNWLTETVGEEMGH